MIQLLFTLESNMCDSQGMPLNIENSFLNG